jgi:hypothetical protein
LQLPRIADSEGGVDLKQAEGVLSELSAELPPRTDWLIDGAGSSPRTLSFQAVDVAEVAEALQDFHYLRSPRRDGRAYTLSTAGGRMVAFCVSSPTDVPRPQELLSRAGIGSSAATRVVSRVFAFDSAPRNTISYLLSRAADEERHLGTNVLTTYVNPNMGFSGSSYRASGWRLLGEEPGTRYRYVDERYVTDRALRTMYGERTDVELRNILGARFEVSTMPLLPLLIFFRELR